MSKSEVEDQDDAALVGLPAADGEQAGVGGAGEEHSGGDDGRCS